MFSIGFIDYMTMSRTARSALVFGKLLAIDLQVSPGVCFRLVGAGRVLTQVCILVSRGWVMEDLHRDRDLVSDVIPIRVGGGSA
jgi:hypothetical protein